MMNWETRSWWDWIDVEVLLVVLVEFHGDDKKTSFEMPKE